MLMHDNPLLYVPLIPSSSKFSTVLKAVEKGLNVLCEKPLANNRKEV